MEIYLSALDSRLLECEEGDNRTYHMFALPLFPKTAYIFYMCFGGFGNRLANFEFCTSGFLVKYQHYAVTPEKIYITNIHYSFFKLSLRGVII
jgi:hypothetical protein